MREPGTVREPRSGDAAHQRPPLGAVVVDHHHQSGQAVFPIIGAHVLGMYALVLVVGDVVAVDEAARSVTLGDTRVLPYDYLVLATGSRIVPEEIEHFDQEAFHFYTAEAAARLRVLPKVRIPLQPIDVLLGEQTTNEMCLEIFGLSIPAPPQPATLTEPFPLPELGALKMNPNLLKR